MPARSTASHNEAGPLRHACAARIAHLLEHTGHLHDTDLPIGNKLCALAYSRLALADWPFTSPIDKLHVCAQVREDVTRYRYGDEQHLDEALDRVFRFNKVLRRASSLSTILDGCAFGV